MRHESLVSHYSFYRLLFSLTLVVLIFSGQKAYSFEIFEITNIHPSYVPADAIPHEVVITGLGFTPSTRVLIEGGEEPVQYVSPFEMRINPSFYQEGLFALEVRDSCEDCSAFWENGLIAVSPEDLLSEIPNEHRTLMQKATAAILASETANCTKAVPNDGKDDSAALIDCLSKAGITRLAPGSYDIRYTVSVGADNVTLRTIDNPDCRTAPSSCAVLIAKPGLVGTILLNNGWSYFRLTSIVVDGNKENRTYSCSGYRGDGSNILIMSGRDLNVGFYASKMVSRNTRCGSALEVTGQNFEIKNSYFLENGFRRLAGTEQPWSDGITIIKCTRTSTGPAYAVHDNLVKNSTDVGIVSGGGNGEGSGCLIHRNSISQTTSHAFYGLQLSWFNGGAGNHSKMIYDANTIASRADGLDFGLCVGAHPWLITKCVSGGLVRYNQVSGATVNLAVDGYYNGSVIDNPLSGPRDGGRDIFPLCYSSKLPTNFTSGDYSNVQLQDGHIPLVFHQGDCCVPGDPGCSISCP